MLGHAPIPDFNANPGDTRSFYAQVPAASEARVRLVSGRFGIVMSEI